jgi:formylglycine-generating enzyme
MDSEAGSGSSSCAPGGAGMTTCPAGTGSESCCASVEVPGGTYYRTYTNSGSGPTGEADQAAVSSFKLDKYLVTVGRFRQFVNAVLPPDGGTGWLPSPGSGMHTYLSGGGLVNSADDAGIAYETGWDTSWNGNIAPTSANLACNGSSSTWTDVVGSNENLPIECVNWYEAYAFCIWDGGFLPSEAEWEYAAAGGSQQLEYPWGSAAPGAGTQYAIYGFNYAGTSNTGSPTDLAPVGTTTLGAGRWGQFDMAGEVWEWNLDAYATYVDPCMDCAYLAAPSSQVLRGCDFNDPASYLLPPIRNFAGPTDRSVSGYNYYDYTAIGLRCARAP